MGTQSEASRQSSLANLAKAHEANRKRGRERHIAHVKRDASYCRPAGGGEFYTEDFNGFGSLFPRIENDPYVDSFNDLALFPLYHSRKDYNGIA